MKAEIRRGDKHAVPGRAFVRFKKNVEKNVEFPLETFFRIWHTQRR